ncbi:MAG TPA: DsbE family thiol:disulfide interchange protein [Beijerinckiaceae bacterium]|nr:DsbE family thiol:disulfide interchange protein [Rhodoblastus sp.]HPG03242.1 DsbE family thiol:disulfide interchange protein [Rhodoblastus sp.]HRY01829.1 DsbE family thiol:disulfide interchange protein [Beijerinckiaceae bacterium]
MNSDLTAGPTAGRARRMIYWAPVAAAIAIGTLFAWGFTRDPKTLPSAMIHKPIPTFDLPPVKGRALGLSSKNLRGEVSLVNVFASWCVECRIEHPLVMQLKARGVTVHGLNYKDRPDDAARWLDKLGDPYVRTGADASGRVAIDWGVYGVPETFVVSSDGLIAYKHVGPLSQELLDETIIPLISRLKKPATGASAARPVGVSSTAEQN